MKVAEIEFACIAFGRVLWVVFLLLSVACSVRSELVCSTIHELRPDKLSARIHACYVTMAVLVLALTHWWRST